jgi:hypothetical protein
MAAPQESNGKADAPQEDQVSNNFICTAGNMRDL